MCLVFLLKKTSDRKEVRNWSEPVISMSTEESGETSQPPPVRVPSPPSRVRGGSDPFLIFCRCFRLVTAITALLCVAVNTLSAFRCFSNAKDVLNYSVYLPFLCYFDLLPSYFLDNIFCYSDFWWNFSVLCGVNRIFRGRSWDWMELHYQIFEGEVLLFKFLLLKILYKRLNICYQKQVPFGCPDFICVFSKKLNMCLQLLYQLC